MNPYKTARELKGFTQKEVALTLKVSVQAVSYWEVGERKPSYPILLKLADLYGTTTDYLLGREKAPTSDALTPTEQKLISEYRTLNREGREYINNTMFMASQIYKNSSGEDPDVEKLG